MAVVARDSQSLSSAGPKSKWDFVFIAGMSQTVVLA
jgi:hypothetical protein